MTGTATCCRSAVRTPGWSRSWRAPSWSSLAIGCVREIREGVARRRRAERGGRRGRRTHDDPGHQLGPRARARLQGPAEAGWWPCPAASSSARPPGAWRCPPTPRWRRQIGEFVWAHPSVRLDDRARDTLDELSEEHDRASATVALSYAEDADLDGLELGGTLRPFQRAGVRYALERRRTFIADEQGLGKTVQALGCAGGRRRLPRDRGVPGVDEADVGAREPQVAARALGRDPERAHRGRLARGSEERGADRRELRHPGRAFRPPGRARGQGAGAGRVALREEPAGAAHQGGVGAGPAAARPGAAAGADGHADPEPRRRSWWPSCGCWTGSRSSAAAPAWRGASAPPAATTACTGTCARTATCAARRRRCCPSCPPRPRTRCRSCCRTRPTTAWRRPT